MRRILQLTLAKLTVSGGNSVTHGVNEAHESATADYDRLRYAEPERRVCGLESGSGLTGRGAHKFEGILR
jgi:hypothetical protein